MHFLQALLTAAGLFLSLPLPAPAAAEPRHGIAMHGEPKHGEDFSAVAHVNPSVPKGGALVVGAQGSFDSLNPFIVKGVAGAGVRDYVFESLMTRSLDEPFTLYGLLAESIDVPDDRSSAAFTLRPEARFSDGKPVTVEDVLFSWRVLRDHGRPNFRSYYKKVTAAEKTGPRTVTFRIQADGDREMPLILGLMPVLPSHVYTEESVQLTSLTPPVGSGPYLLSEAVPGRSITYNRNPDYWGRSLPVNRGLYNFDTIRFEYYRDVNSMREAFRKGLFHIQVEGDPQRWATDYDFPAVTEGRVRRAEFATGAPAGMRALVFNTRRAVFADRRVREALSLLFDFAWINKSLFHGLYTRTDSYFARSALSSAGKPAGDIERALLAPFADAMLPDAMEGRPLLPAGTGDGFGRDAARRALALLKGAGYVLRDGDMVRADTGVPLAFEMLAATRDQERLFLIYLRRLQKLGIAATIKVADSAQYERRKQQFDFDMIENSWVSSLSPGNEQNFRWSKAAADAKGSFNYAGVKSDAVDAMIGALLAAKDRDTFTAAVRALDRVLLSGHYVIPLFHLPAQWVAYWSHLRHPDKPTLYGFKIDTWWHDAARMPVADGGEKASR